MTRRWALLLALASLGPTAAWADPPGANPAPPAPAPTDAQVRRAVERGLPFLEAAGTGWNRYYSCVMCHHQPMMIWAHNEARARGIRVDDTKLREWTDRAWSQFLAPASFRLSPADAGDLRAAGVPAGVIDRALSLHQPVIFPTEATFLAALGKRLAPDELARHKAALLASARRDIFQLSADQLANGGVPGDVAAKLTGLYPWYSSEAEFRAVLAKLLTAEEQARHLAALLETARAHAKGFSLSVVGRHIIADEKLPIEVAAKLAPLRVGTYYAGGIWTEEEYLKALGGVLPAAEWQPHRAKLLEHARKPQKPDGALESKAWLLLGRPSDGDARRQAAVGELVSLMVKTQEPAGTWRAWLGGQQHSPDTWRPVATLWAVLALGSIPDNPEAARGRDPALEWIKKQPWFENELQIVDWKDFGPWNEPLLLQAWLAHQVGDARRAGPLLREMLARQNPDGGWSTWKGNQSDAFGTGQALYVLSVLGRGSADPVVQRARAYLVGRLQADGSWGFAGGGARPSYWRGNPPATSDVNDVRGYWGSAWAVIGLARTLPRPAD